MTRSRPHPTAGFRAVSRAEPAVACERIPTGNTVQCANRSTWRSDPYRTFNKFLTCCARSFWKRA